MATKKKRTTPETGRAEERLWRIHQRAHKFADLKKKASKNACRGKNWDR